MQTSLRSPFWLKLVVVIRQIAVQFIMDNCPLRAAALAFTSLLSLVPLMAVSFTVMAAFPIFKELSGQVQDFIFKNFVAASAEIIQSHVQQFAGQATNLSVTGMFVLVVTAVLMIFNMEQAFNAIWRVHRSRKGVPALMLYWGLLTFIPILIGVGFAISSYIFSLPFIKGATATLGLQKPLLTLSPYLLTFIAFSVLYMALPNCKVLVRHAAIGGFVAMCLFELAKYGFALYVVNFPTYALLYGTLAAIPIFLFWVYLSWLVVLVGAVVAHVAGSSKETMQLQSNQSI